MQSVGCTWDCCIEPSSTRRTSRRSQCSPVPGLSGDAFRSRCGPARGVGRGSPYLEVLGRGFAAVAYDLVFDLLALIERAKSSALDGRNMHEHVLTPTLRLDEAIALGGIEPFHGADRH